METSVSDLLPEILPDGGGGNAEHFAPGIPRPQAL